MKHYIDLHLHLDGSLPVNTVQKLLKEHNLTYTDTQLTQELFVDKSCASLDQFLTKFALPNKLMQTKHDIKTIVYDLLVELKRQGLVYAEIRFAPQIHTKTLSQKQVIEAAISGLNEFLADQNAKDDNAPELHAGLILCLMRYANNQKENMETVELAGQFLNHGVVGIDLAGPEGIIPNIKYKKFFDRAQELKIPYTIHAGEAAEPASIRQAIAIGAKRIGHGIRCVEDPELEQEIIDRKITLECCASSNLDTKAFNKINSYPIKDLLNMGMKVTLNSDDMTVSNTNLPKEYKLLENAINLTSNEEKTLYLNSVNAAFASQEEKNRLKSL